MIERLKSWIEQLQGWSSFELSWTSVMWGVLIFIVTFTISIAAVSYVIVRLPPTYFQASHSRAFLVGRHPAMRWSALILKNIFGLFLVLLGMVMSLPGVPGQGVLTILLGLMIMDFPGKRRLEHKLVSRPKVLKAINRLRAKFDRPPIVLDH